MKDTKLPSKGRPIAPYGRLIASQTGTNRPKIGFGKDGTPQGEFSMKRQPRILAGTALGLLMASAPLGAFPLQGNAAFGPAQRTSAPFILAQAACAEGESAEACAQKQQAEAGTEARERRRGPAATGERPPRPSSPLQREEQQPRKKHDSSSRPSSAPAEQAAPAAEEQQPRKKKHDQQQQIEAAPAEQAALPSKPLRRRGTAQPRKKKRDQQQQTEAGASRSRPPRPADEQQPSRARRSAISSSRRGAAERTASPAGRASRADRA